MLRHCTSMRSAVGLGGLAPAVLRCECNGQLDGSRFCKFEKASRLATTARSRTECIRQPTRVCIKLTTCKGHDSLMPAPMHDSRRYRDSAAECLWAAQQACQPYYRKLHLSMAASWLSLARQDEAGGRGPFRSVCGNRKPARGRCGYGRPALGGGYCKSRSAQGRQRLPGRAVQPDILVCIVERMWVIAQKSLDCQTFGHDGFVRVQLNMEIGQR